MTEPVAIDAANFFEFIAGEGLKVVLVSLHPFHTFNPDLHRQLAVESEPITLGTVHLYDLVAEGAPALRFLHQGLRACGAPSLFGVLPGYCLFRGGEMLAWDAGLPTFADVEAMARSALLGAVCSGVLRDAGYLGQALRRAAEQLAAHRVAMRFRHAVADRGASRRAAGDDSQAPIDDDLYWAYQMLGVLPTATDREIHEAWRRRRVENHPDHAQDQMEFERRTRISAAINRARDTIVSHRSGGARRATYSAA